MTSRALDLIASKFDVLHQKFDKLSMNVVAMVSMLCEIYEINFYEANFF